VLLLMLLATGMVGLVMVMARAVTVDPVRPGMAAMAVVKGTTATVATSTSPCAAT
jgi:hypothetical protein